MYFGLFTYNRSAIGSFQPMFIILQMSGIPDEILSIIHEILFIFFISVCFIFFYPFSYS